MAKDDVLLAAHVNVYDAQTHRGKVAASYRVIDQGDQVVFFHNDVQSVWRLPDQPPLQPDVPVLSRAVLLSWDQYSKSSTVANNSRKSLVLVDDSNRVLFTLISAGDITDTDIPRLWPTEAFGLLATRGVPYDEEQLDDADEVARRYPGGASAWKRATTSRAAARRMTIFVTAVGFVVAGLVLFIWLSKG